MLASTAARLVEGSGVGHPRRISRSESQLCRGSSWSSQDYLIAGGGAVLAHAALSWLTGSLAVGFALTCALAVMMIVTMLLGSLIEDRPMIAKILTHLGWSVPGTAPSAARAFDRSHLA